MWVTLKLPYKCDLRICYCVPDVTKEEGLLHSPIVKYTQIKDVVVITYN